MRWNSKRLTALVLAAVLSAAGAMSASAAVVEAGASRRTQTSQTGGPGSSGGPGASGVTELPVQQVEQAPVQNPVQAQNPVQTTTPVQGPTAGPSGTPAPAQTQTSGTITAPGPTSMPQITYQPAGGEVIQNAVAVDMVYGPNGEILRLSMKLDESIKGTITYGVYVNNGGFIPWQADGNMNGGTEDSTHVEALQVALTGEAGKLYDVYYRGQSRSAGLHGWARNEELMGTIDRGDWLTNVEVVIVPKDSARPGSYEGRFYSNHSEYIRISDNGSTYSTGYTGWVDHDQARYYFVNGQALTGWQYIDGLKFFFNNSGALIMDVDEIIGPQKSYIVKVNKELNCATVYAKGEESDYIIPVKAMLTSVGDDTPVGTHHTPEKYRWRLMVNDTFTQYATRISGGVLFHSITYEKTDIMTLITGGYNRLGVSRSLGCVRLNVKNAKWIYDNCAIGTEVIVYEDPTTPGPFFKPYQKWIPEDQTWDPTDPACADL